VAEGSKTADLEMTGGAQIEDVVSTVVAQNDVVDQPVNLRRRLSH